MGGVGVDRAGPERGVSGGVPEEEEEQELARSGHRELPADGSLQHAHDDRNNGPCGQPLSRGMRAAIS
jgi:hypothetical protein